MTQHAYYSASSSSKWLNCLGSLHAEKEYKKKDTPYSAAAIGTVAHHIADICLSSNSNAIDHLNTKVNDIDVDEEMCTYVDHYVDYVRSYQRHDTINYCEQRVSYEKYAKNGFGTLDASVVDFKNRTIHIFDLKYGIGVKVDAYQNTQAQLYCLGLMSELDVLSIDEKIDEFLIHICQVRLSHFDTWKISKDDLMKFGNYVKHRVDLIEQGDLTRTPGDKQCRWCLALPDCSAVKEHLESKMKSRFSDMNDMTYEKLTDQEKLDVFLNKDLFTLFIKSIDTYFMDKLSSGESVKGLKLIRGKTTSKWKEDIAERVLVDILEDKAYKRKLIGITDARKMIKDKKLIDNLIFKQEGTLKLVKESEKGHPVNTKELFKSMEH